MAPDPDIFFAIMIGMIKNDFVSYQVFAKLTSNKTINELKNRISDAKANDNYDNYEIIFLMEKELYKLTEAAMVAEISKHPKFELLNNEKITPYFMNLVKQCKSNDSLALIRNDAGEDFASERARNQYITNYYRRLYTRDANAIELNDQSINEFLGEAICESSIV
jgi:predicted nucleic acid-binding protein